MQSTPASTIPVFEISAPGARGRRVVFLSIGYINLSSPMKNVNYGIDSPGVIRNLFILGFTLIAAALWLPPISVPRLLFKINAIIFTIGGGLVLEAVLMILYSKYGKFRHRDRMLALHNWRGNENVLDVGTGSGMLMIAAAKRLTTGMCVGIDIWNTDELRGNSMLRTRQNVDDEGVTGRAEIVTRNILKTYFSNNRFDVILSNQCLHNLLGMQERELACREINRVLKKDGVAIISDFKYGKEIERVFKKLGMQVQNMGTYYLDTFPPLTIIKAAKTRGD